MWPSRRNKDLVRDKKSISQILHDHYLSLPLSLWTLSCPDLGSNSVWDIPVLYLIFSHEILTIRSFWAFRKLVNFFTMAQQMTNQVTQMAVSNFMVPKTQHFWKTFQIWTSHIKTTGKESCSGHFHHHFCRGDSFSSFTTNHVGCLTHRQQGEV